MDSSSADSIEEPSYGSASIQSVERAVQLLRLFLPNRGLLGPTEIAQLSGMSVSTAHRYCSALRRAGLLRYEADTGRYGLGGGCIELGLAATESLPVVELARPLFSELVQRVDRTAVLGVWDEEGVRIVEVNDHTSAIARISVRVGSRLSVFTTAQGLIFLAFDRRVRQRFARSPEIDSVAETLKAIERDKCAIVSAAGGEKVIPGITTVAVPVFLGDLVVATAAIIGSTESMPTSADSRIVDHLREVATQLGRQLSGQ